MSKSKQDFGPVNGYLVGAAMREALRRACKIVNDYKHRVRAKTKGVREDGRPDVYTHADVVAQHRIVAMLGKYFPGFGFVAEEKTCVIPCTLPGRDLWWTVDPLDGTSAFLRGQSHGIGSQIALLDGGRVIAAYVRDANTGEIYGFHPASRNTWRITSSDRRFRLRIRRGRPLSDQYLLLRDPPDRHDSQIVEALSARGGPFKSYDMADGSIGISTARLWKGEVGAAVLRGGENTPWDWAPVVGISLRLGFGVFSIVDEPNAAGQTGFLPFDCAVSKARQRVEYPLLIVHQSRLDELEAWMRPALGPSFVLVRR